MDWLVVVKDGIEIGLSSSRLNRTLLTERLDGRADWEARESKLSRRVSEAQRREQEAWKDGI